MDKDTLKKLIDDDDFGILNEKPKASPGHTADDRLRNSFIEILDFVRKEGREPSPNKKNIQEMKLYSRLQGLRQNPEKISLLKSIDNVNLLGELKAIETIADIFSDDSMSILSDEAENIFELKNVPSAKVVTNTAEYIAQRKPCEDFAEFEAFFKQCQKDLLAGRRVFSPFSRGTSIDPGDAFLLKGMLVFVASQHKREDQPNAEQGKMNDRLRCIFENGTESDMLRRSLAARLYEENGQRISKSTEQTFNDLTEVTAEDKVSGYVYVLRSLSPKSEIKGTKNLFKIGFCKGAIEDRIANAANEPTYLMAPVAIVTAFECYDLNPRKLEYLLHVFFDKVCLEIKVVGPDGKTYRPKEWFVAPISVITEAVLLLKREEIVNYRFSPESQSVERR